MEESESDSVRPEKYARPTGLRVKKVNLFDRPIYWNTTGQPVSLKTPARLLTRKNRPWTVA